jgi:site-specific DNA-cytosine methylase
MKDRYNNFTDISHDWAEEGSNHVSLYSKNKSIDGLNVLSCFDGLSGGQLALEKAGIKVNQYFASEIDKYAIAVAKYNFPNMIHLGDVKKIDTSQLPKIDLMLAGSPCTDLSFAGLGKGLIDGAQSSLFFDWWSLVKELKPTYIFLENVRMKKEYEDMISETLGFNPIAINSSLVSAQNRYRLYWFGIRDGDIYKAIPIAQPKDKGIVLADGVRKDNQLDLPLKPYLEVREDDKTNCLSTVQKDNVIVEGLTWRKLTPRECARLQTVPDEYCTMGSFDGIVKPISKSQQYKMLGNGWTIDVIAHILQDIRLKGWW